jgi:hypothetical protein
MPHHSLPCNDEYTRVEGSSVSSRVANVNSATLRVAARIAVEQASYWLLVIG